MRISISSQRRILFVVVLFALITQLSLRIDTDSIVRAQSGSPTTAWGLIRHLQATGEKAERTGGSPRPHGAKRGLSHTGRAGYAGHMVVRVIQIARFGSCGNRPAWATQPQAIEAQVVRPSCYGQIWQVVDSVGFSGVAHRTGRFPQLNDFRPWLIMEAVNRHDSTWFTRASRGGDASRLEERAQIPAI